MRGAGAARAVSRGGRRGCGDGSPRAARGKLTFAVVLRLARVLGALRSGAVPVVVEGALDVIAVTTAGAGRYVGVAPCGTALTGAKWLDT